MSIRTNPAGRMHRALTGVLIVALWLAWWSEGFAQSPDQPAQDLRKVDGKVTDQSGAALLRVIVQIRDNSGRLAAEAQTNGRGEFSVDLHEGPYLVTATLAGFAPLKNQALEVTSSTSPLDLILQVPMVEQRIVVTATATEAPLSQVGSGVSIIRGDELARGGIQNAADALRRVAGVSLAQSGGNGQVTSLFMRGGESKYTKVLIDGIAANDPGGGYNFANLSIADIDRIEIVRGPQSALFGSDATAGVIQIFTHRGSSEGLSPKPRILFEGGTFASYRYAAGIEGKGRRVDYSASFTRSDTDNDTLNGSFNQETAAVNLGIAISKSAELRAVFRSEAGRTGVPGQHAFQRSDPEEYYRHRDLAGGLTFTRQTSASWKQKLYYSIDDSRQLSEDPADSGSFVPAYEGTTGPYPIPDFVFQTLNQTRRQKLGYQSDWSLPKGHILSGGVEYERESGIIGDPKSDPLEAARNNYGGYFQDQWAFRNRLFAAAGVRLEENDSFGFFAAPRLSVALHLRQPVSGGFWGITKLKGSFGMGIKEPTLIESFSKSPYFKGNPNLKPEKSSSFDAGVEQQFRSGRGVVEITCFDNRFRDQIAYVTTDYVTFEGTFFNLGKTRARGAETSLRQELAWHFELSGAYTYLDGRVVQSTNAFNPVFAAGRELLRRPRHSGYVDLRWKPGRWTFGITGIFVGSRVDSDFEGLGLTRNSGYSVLNLLLNFRISDTTSVYALANNVTNEKYMEVLGYPALRASFRLGIRTGF